ncbi:HTH-type transcriptional regulator AbgR [Xenorhabdus innexi]|uniref:DNA-binding transcriptional activator TdcA n=2 Tax=Xenorhabdus innexi TaxID=290109 RepID=A0A1N6N095_9GAMM|nr:DNA-binding transcriptional activator TdcA [Xenorhabdus innexi]SIP74507.1 HTH-type transcriptional regulator AbgR [Xenorhabdus innexi]
MSIKLHQIRAFVEISRYGSIRSASRTLSLSQPALTKSIRELEDSLGAKLFIRSNQGIHLTECGQSFLSRASLILEELRVAQEDIQQRIGLLGGVVNIGIAGCLVRTIMPKIIAQFHREYPTVKLRIVEGQLLAMLPQLRQGELDFSVNTYYPDSADSDLSSEKLTEKEYKVIVRKGHPKEHATSLEELSDCDWTMPTPKGTYYRRLFEMLSLMALPPVFSVTCETLMSCMSLVAKSDFVTIVAVDLADDALFHQQFVALDLKEQLPLATFCLIHRKDKKLTPAGEHLAKLFRMYCRP